MRIVFQPKIWMNLEATHQMKTLDTDAMPQVPALA